MAYVGRACSARWQGFSDFCAAGLWAYVLVNSAQSHVEPPMVYDEFVRQTGWPLFRSNAAARSVVNAR